MFAILFFATGFGMVERGPFATEGEAMMDAALFAREAGDFQWGWITNGLEGPRVSLVRPSTTVADAIEFVPAENVTQEELSELSGI